MKTKDMSDEISSLRRDVDILIVILTILTTLSVMGWVFTIATFSQLNPVQKCPDKVMKDMSYLSERTDIANLLTRCNYNCTKVSFYEDWVQCIRIS